MTKRSYNFHKSILRAYDIRGVLDDTLSLDDAYFIGLSFGSLMKNKYSGKKICIGFDGRLSSPVLAEKLIMGLSETGMECINIGCGPSPMLYYSVYNQNADAGIMITGSHNPPEFNGFKFMMPKKVFHGDDIKLLGKISKDGVFNYGEGSVSQLSIEKDYVSNLIKNINFSPKVKIAWDPGNGAASNIISRLILELPGQHFLINGTIDGTFPNHHPDPTVEDNLEQLKDVVRKNECDLGFAFDGDGDRLGVIDKRGRVIWGDQILAILSKFILKNNPGATIIGDVKCSSVLFNEIERLGGNPIMWASGHSLIKEKMIETGAKLAGEMSAHIFFSDEYYGFDDAIYCSLRMLQAINLEDKSLDEIFDNLPKMVNTKEARIDCPEEEKFDIIENIISKMQENPNHDICRIDGLRVSCEYGWWLLRASNTQACLTARCESKDELGLAQLKSNIIDLLKENNVNVNLKVFE